MSKKPRRKKKKRKGRSVKEEEPEAGPGSDQESVDEVDAAVREVNKLLGEVGRERGGEKEAGGGTESSPAPHSLLKVDRRYCDCRFSV